MAKIVHQKFPDAPHIADLAAGHGLLAWILVLTARLGEKPFLRTAVAIDIVRPKSAETLADAVKEKWPELSDAVYFVEGSIDSVRTANGPETVFVSIHACGSLSDRVLVAALASGSSVAIMPCCHSLRKQGQTLAALANLSRLSADCIMANPDSIDQFRSRALGALGYSVSGEKIQPEITKFHRIIIGKAPEGFRSEVSLTPSQFNGPVKQRGEIQAFEKIQILNISDWADIRELSKRPSREWKRSFDMSFWVEDEGDGELLMSRLRSLTAGLRFNTIVTIHDRFTHPANQQLSMTFRIEMMSFSQPITKDDALSLRETLCQTLKGTYVLRS